MQDKLEAEAGGQLNNSAAGPEPAIQSWTNLHKHDMDLIPAAGLAPDESAVAAFLGDKTSCHVDELAAGLGMQISRLNATLSMMEIKGAIRRLPGMYYSLRIKGL